jgi:hypothetical protein
LLFLIFFILHTHEMAATGKLADPAKKVSQEDFELLSVLGTGGE